MSLTRAQRRTLGVVWATYGTFYVCRVNIGPARKSIQDDLGLTALEIGFVLGAIKVGYAIGQLVNGQLVERFGAKRILVIGMLGSVAATLAFAACVPLAGGLAPALDAIASHLPSSIRAMAVLLVLIAFLNGYFQAGGWPPTVKVMSNWFSAAQRGRIMGVIGTSYQLGSAATILGAGALIAAFGGAWRAAFIVPAAVFFLSALHTMARLRERPADSAATIEEERRVKRGVWSTLAMTLGNGKLWLLALGLLGLDIVRYGFLDWAPGQLQEAQRSGVTAAAMKAAVLPLAGAAGALVSGWMSDRFFGSRRAPVIAIMMLAVGVLTLMYPSLVALGAAPTVVCLAGIGFFVYGAQILLVGTGAQDFARAGTSAAAAGFIDFTGSMGAFGGDVVTGWLLRSGRGWGGAISFWAGSAIVAAMLVSLLWRAKPRDLEQIVA